MFIKAKLGIIGMLAVMLLAIYLYCVNVASALQSNKPFAQWTGSDIICSVGFVVAPVGVICGAVHDFK